MAAGPMADTPIRVLLVEDDDGYAEFLNAELDAPPFQLTLRRASSLRRAIDALNDSAVDVVLLDLGLPDSSGLGSLRRMQQAARDIPIVVLTAHDSDAQAIAAVQDGAEDYLIKSHTDAQLLFRSLRYACERAAFRRTIVEREQALYEREQQLRQAQKMEAVGRLAGGVAHDFNNVLTAIFGYADLLLEQFAGDDPRRADVEEIRRSADRAAGLTRQLLAFSRKQVMQPRVISLNEVIGNMRKLVAQLVGEEVTLQFQLADDLWQVCADPGQIGQVLMNLCVNSRDAMPEGGSLRIVTENRTVTAAEVHVRPGLRAGPHVLVTVADTGHGMTESVRQHVFEPFFTTKEQGKGTGLGLPTAYGIVKQSGGGIYLESEPGRGTTFFVYLPRTEAAVALESAEIA